MSVLITGASGFVGQRLAHALQARSREIRLASRRMLPVGVLAEAAHMTGDGQRPQDWQAAVAGCHAVIHLAARAHVLKENAGDPLAVFRQANVSLSLACARAAADAGVRRFVFISSIGVHGNQTMLKPFEAHDQPAPHSPYAVSKMEAEQALQGLCQNTGMELVVVRPPLVYGPEAPGNFGSLIRALQRGLPLPLGAITSNRRSLVALDNLIDLLITCIDHPAAANETFLVSDGEDISTTALVRRMGLALGRPARLLPVPPSLLQGVASALGRQDAAQRLLASLQVDIAHTRATLGWSPPITLDEGLRRAALPMVSR